MKILLALPRPLFPADTGGKIRSLQIFSRLAKRHHIHAVSFADCVRDAAHLPGMESLFTAYTPVFWTEAKAGSARFYMELLANQCRSLPYFLSKFDLPLFAERVEKLLEADHFDVLLCDFLHTAVALRKVHFSTKVLFEHNVEFLLRKRKWEMEKNLLRKLVLANEWRRTHRVEGELCRAFEHVLTVSEQDGEIIQHSFGVKNVSVLPTGVDADFFQPSEDGCRQGHLVFVGSMDWAANEDGILWFTREVYPQIRRRVRNASLAIVGRNPSSVVQDLASNDHSITVTGWVPDVRPYLARAQVVVVPLRVGGGTRVKIPEAMAMQKAVVSTPIGAEGLPFMNHRHIAIAESAQQFASRTVELLEDKRLRDAMAAAARNVVEADHRWETVIDKLELVLQQVASTEACAIAA